MAAHRKDRSAWTRSVRGPGTRAWASLALAGAATATAAVSGAGGALAAPRPDARQVRAEVDRLQRDAEAAGELHHAAKERSRKAERRLTALQDRSARTAARVNAARDTLGSHATTQYRNGQAATPAQLALASDPEDFLRHAATRERAGLRQSRTLRQLRGRLRESTQLRREGAERADEVRAAEREARRHKETARGKLAKAERLLKQLTPEERAPGERTEGDRGGEDGRADRGARPSPGAPAPATPVPAASGRAAQAIAFARDAIGKPYVWGATGPGSYDCSGLTQAAWRAAGVSLPRTTYTQVDAGRRVSRAELAPGDLVFFYQGLSHVGLYIGNGQMIHAPRPGSTVTVAPVDSMPFAAATRPA